MKIHSPRVRGHSRWVSAALVLLLSAAWAGCSGNAPPVVAEGELTGAENPSPEPMAAGAGQKDPDATETNFITLPCATDADCRGEDRCIFPPGVDAGAGSDAGVVVRGRCKVPGSP
jgi:hypothetical protein